MIVFQLKAFKLDGMNTQRELPDNNDDNAFSIISCMPMPGCHLYQTQMENIW